MFRRGFLKRIACCVLLPLADLVPLPQLAKEVKKPVIKEYTVCLMTGYEEVRYPGYSRQRARFLLNEEDDTLINIDNFHFPIPERGKVLITGVEVRNEEGKPIASGPVQRSCLLNEVTYPVFAENSLSVVEASASGVAL